MATTSEKDITKNDANIDVKNNQVVVKIADTINILILLPHQLYDYNKSKGTTPIQYSDVSFILIIF